MCRIKHLKGVGKKPNLAVLIRSEFREKQRSLQPVGFGPLFFQFLKDCFSRNSDRIETARLVFFQHPLFFVTPYKQGQKGNKSC